MSLREAGRHVVERVRPFACGLATAYALLFSSWLYSTASVAAQQGPARSPSGYSVKRLELPNISSALWESHPAIDPLSGDLWFVRSDPSFSGWHILLSRCDHDVLQAPTASPFAAPGIEADPYFTSDGKQLYYISTGPSGSRSSADLDIWRVMRQPNGVWSKPERLPGPVNSSFAEWFPRPAPDGWIYFGSRRPGGFGKDDIWKARLERSGKWTVVNAGPAINSPDAEYEFLPSTDGTSALLATDKGLFRVERRGRRWVRRSRLGPEVNQTGTEIGPLAISPGHSFVFSRDAGEGRSGELFFADDGSPADSARMCGSFKDALQFARGSR